MRPRFWGLLALVAMARAVLAAGQSHPPTAGGPSDEFSDPGALSHWQWLHEREGGADLSGWVRSGSGGQLIMEPQISAWYGDWRGPLLYQEVEGDFDVSVRVDPRGLTGATPEIPWSLAGVMVRRPQPPGAVPGTPGSEHWLFITAGVGQVAGRIVVETKSTVRGRSDLRLTPACGGWIELRIIRVAEHFLLLSRCPGQEWRREAGFTRPDLAGRVQVGLIAYSGWEVLFARYGAGGEREFAARGMPEGRPGLRAVFDHIRSQAPARHPADWWQRASAGGLNAAELIQGIGRGANP